MKISKIEIKNFKRFTHLTIQNIPETTKLVLVVGPNGSGKSSLFDLFLFWYKYKFQGSYMSGDYYVKKNSSNDNGNMYESVNISFYDLLNYEQKDLQGKFYFRTAYRNDADFTVSNLEQQDDPSENIRLNNFIQNDSVVRENYQRLISLTLNGVYEEKNDSKTVYELREELIGKVRKSLSNVFDDLTLSSIGDPLRNGSFYFEKGISKNFHYKNLSGGEKSAFDLILDIIIKTSYYQNSIYCIDEPETHMHTQLQAKLLEEIYNLIPPESQLWINTHSLGMLKRARDIEKKHSQTITFIDFNNRDFDQPTIIEPSIIDKTIWDKFIEMTLDDLSTLISPKQIVFCEGNSAGRKYKDFDAQIFSRIFSGKYTDTTFLSIGSSNDLEKEDNTTFKVIKNVLKGSELIKIVDRDDKSDQEIQELSQKGIKVLKKRHIESYLLDDEILEKLCRSTSNEDKIGSVLSAKAEAINKSAVRGNPIDDIKSASGEIYVELKRILNLTKCGNTKDAFFRDTICSLITEDTNIHKQLEIEIFN